MKEEKDKRTIGQDIPRDINTEDIDFEHSAKKWKSQEKIDINESELGRSLSQEPYEEHKSEKQSQIDEETVRLQEKKK